MKHGAFAAIIAAVLGTAGVSQAADLSLKDTPAPDYSFSPAALWTGLYIGGHAGGAWGNVKFTDTYDYMVQDPTLVTKLGTNGLIGGAQIGYNFQRGRIVYGVEGDLGYLNLSGSKAVKLLERRDHEKNSLCSGTGAKQECSLDGAYSSSGGLYGDLTGRLGYSMDNTLLYLKGGLAFLNTDFTAQYVGQNCSSLGKCRGGTGKTSNFDYDLSETMWGWTVGFGVEYALSSSLSLKAEYQHFDFGTTSYTHNGTDTFWGTTGVATLSGSADIAVTVDAVSVGLNYRLNGASESLK